MLLGYGRLACYWWFKPYTHCATNPRAHVESPTPDSTEPSSHLLLIVPLQSTKPTSWQYRKSVNLILVHIYIELPMSFSSWYLEPELYSYTTLALCSYYPTLLHVTPSMRWYYVSAWEASQSTFFTWYWRVIYYHQNSRARITLLSVFLQANFSLFSRANPKFQLSV